MDLSDNGKCSFTSLQYVESSHAPYQRIRFFITNMWQVYTRPTSASDFSLKSKYVKDLVKTFRSKEWKNGEENSINAQKFVPMQFLCQKTSRYKIASFLFKNG
jgi:hypothetical protein